MGYMHARPPQPAVTSPLPLPGPRNYPKCPKKGTSQGPKERPAHSDTLSRNQDQAFCSGLSSEQDVGELGGLLQLYLRLKGSGEPP